LSADLGEKYSKNIEDVAGYLRHSWLCSKKKTLHSS
jgi:hypothetical protein